MKKLLRNVITLLLVLSLTFAVSAETALGQIDMTEPIGFSEKFVEAFTLPDDSTAGMMSETEDSDSYDVYALLEFDYPDLDLSTLEGLDVEARRDAVRDYYKPRNEQIVAQLGLEGVTVSYSAPFADVSFDSITEYQTDRDELITASENDAVEFIGVNLMNYETEEETNSIEYSYQISEVLSDIGISDNAYSGSNIKVGILEINRPDSSVDILTDSYFEYFGGTNTGNHPTRVASLISSVASDVTFFSAATTNSSLTACFNWLVSEKKVNVINMSMTGPLVNDTNASMNGYVYTNYCSYIDYLSATNACLIVKSAGNRGESDDKITAPGMGINILTVGSTNENGTLSSYSSYLEGTTSICKPEVVAPGEGILIPQTNNDSGTSFSAPLVTGIAARLMHEFPELKTDSGLLKMVIMAGSVQLSSIGNMLDGTSGFGQVNYNNSRTLMANEQYNVKYKEENCNFGNLILSVGLDVSPRVIEKLYFSRMVLGNNSSYNNIQVDPNMTTYRIIITYETDDGIVTSNNFLWTDSIDCLVDIHFDGEPREYTVNIYSEDSSDNQVEMIYMAYTGATHRHIYTDYYGFTDNRRHACTCNCGEYYYENHVYPEESTGTYVFCTICGYQKDALPG